MGREDNESAVIPCWLSEGGLGVGYQSESNEQGNINKSQAGKNKARWGGGGGEDPEFRTSQTSTQTRVEDAVRHARAQSLSLSSPCFKTRLRITLLQNDGVQTAEEPGGTVWVADGRPNGLEPRSQPQALLDRRRWG